MQAAGGDGPKTARPARIDHEVRPKLIAEGGIYVPMQLLADAADRACRHLPVKGVTNTGIGKVSEGHNGADEFVASALGRCPFHFPHLVTGRDVDLDVDRLRDAA